MSEFTPDEIEDIFHSCLKVGDVTGVEMCLRAMVGADPVRAVQLYDDLKFALRVASLSKHVAPSGQFCAPAATPEAAS